MLTLVAMTALMPVQATAEVPPGTLISAGKEAIVLPLRRTAVNADISGFGARVTVVQTFTNPTSTPIEAVYTFPLPADSAVDRMRMKIGARVIDGLIKRREEARAIYEAAKNRGQAAALLDQERPNIFTQSVANILPKDVVQIEISYVQLLKYENNEFEFSFPMVVGPRFLGNAPDPAKIQPPVIPKGMRTGADISLNVNLDAGAPIVGMRSVLHEIDRRALSESRAVVSLRKKDEIPNRDFILRYQTATNSVQNALLAKYDPVKGGYFSLVLLPPKDPTPQQIAPREMIFVLDQSGSQIGFPIEKSKELTLQLMDTMHPNDTFNVMGFSNSVNPLWQAPRANTAANRQEAGKFVRTLSANGGTQLRLAIEAAMKAPPDPKRLRLIIFNTDGFVGDEPEILRSIRENSGSLRIFTFGIGNGVNRYLIDAMSDEGRGDSEIVTLAEKADGAVQRFLDRTEKPVLTNVSARFEGSEVTDQLPARLPDVFGDKPVIVYGRYSAPGQAKLHLTGLLGGKPWSQTIDVLFPSDRPGGESIPAMWARRMVDRLDRDYSLGSARAENPSEGESKIVDVALEYGIMSRYTSFVAVEQKVINIGGKQRTVHVPVEMTQGVSYEGTFGTNLAMPAMSRGAITPGGSAGFGGGGSFSGGAGKSMNADLGSIRILSEERIAQLPPAERGPALERLRKSRFEGKVAKSLRTATGPIEVQIWLADVKPETLAALKESGVAIDHAESGLNLAFGRVDAKQLMHLAQLSVVRRIEPIQ